MDALYFRISSDRQTTEHQFEEVLQMAERDGSGRDWQQIRRLLSECVQAEDRNGTGGVRTIYCVVPAVAAELSESGVYVEQGRSREMGAKRRSLFRQMKRDAARKFHRLLVWKVSRLGWDMREVIGRVGLHFSTSLGDAPSDFTSFVSNRLGACGTSTSQMGKSLDHASPTRASD